eukprot:jgi/Undpi1/10519/HiC_scaffold_29.g12969.m1
MAGLIDAGRLCEVFQGGEVLENFRIRRWLGANAFDVVVVLTLQMGKMAEFACCTRHHSGGTVAFVRCYADTNDTPGCVVFVGGCHAAEAAAGAAVTGVAANARCVFSRRKRYSWITGRTTPRSFLIFDGRNIGYQPPFWWMRCPLGKPPRWTSASGNRREKDRSSSLISANMAPFPYMPMLAIMISLVSYLVVQISVFAYAGYMVEHLGVVDDKDKAGYYAGLLSASFMFGSVFSARFWGVVSDRHGTRFVMVVGLVSTVILSLAFGCSTTFAWAFISRFLLGLLNGMMVASKTLVSDVCGKEHETVGMGVVTTSWSIGGVLGPGVGGILAEPAKHYPLTFSKLGLFGRYPYLLPNFVGATLALLSLPLVLVFLKGTQYAKTGAKMLEHPVTAVPATTDQPRVITPVLHAFDDTTTPVRAPPGKPANTWCLPWYGGGDDNDEYNATNYDGSEGGYLPALPSNTLVDEKPSRVRTETTPMVVKSIKSGTGGDTFSGSTGDDLKPKSLLAQPRVRTLLFIEGIYSLSYSGFNEVYSLWSLSTVAKGGLDWSTVQIGQVFLTCGFMVMVFEMFAVPQLTPRLGVRLFQRIGSVFEVPTYFLFPVLSTVNAAGFPVAFASLILLLTCYVCSNSFYIGMSLAINNATEPSRLGELNGISTTLTSLARTISPVVFSTMFAFSIDGSHLFPFDFHLVFYLIGTMRLAVAFMAWNKISDTEVMRGWNVIDDAEGIGAWSKPKATEGMGKPCSREGALESIGKV